MITLLLQIPCSLLYSQDECFLSMLQVEVEDCGVQGRLIGLSITAQSQQALDHAAHILSLLIKGCLETGLAPLPVSMGTSLAEWKGI